MVYGTLRCAEMCSSTAGVYFVPKNTTASDFNFDFWLECLLVLVQVLIHYLIICVLRAVAPFNNHSYCR